MSVLCMLVLCSFLMSKWRFTVSKAFDMSSATIIVLSGGFFALKPLMILFVISCSAVVVECLCLKPC